MYFHITEAEALKIRNRIIEFAKKHFRDQRNWELEFNTGYRVYEYRTPELFDFWNAEGEKLFADISEAGFFFVLKQMRKMGTLDFDSINRDHDTECVKVFVADHYLQVIPAEGTSKTVDDKGRAHYKFSGNPHKNAFFVKGGAL